MRKSVLVNVLVITIVVTIFVFAGMWYLRPGVPNEILQQAKERQLQPLMEVTPPAKKPTAEEVSQTETLARELFPRLQEELEPVLREEISKQILEDDFLLDSLAEQLETMMIPSLSQTLQAEQETFQASLTQELEGYVQVNLDALRTEMSVLQDDMETSVASLLEQLREDMIHEADAYVPQLVDRLIPEVVMQVVAQLEANKETYLQELRSSLPEPGIAEDDAIALYEEYRSAIVMDMVPSLLDSMEKPVRSAVQDYLVEMKFIPPVPRVPTPKISIQVDTPVVEETPAPEQTEAIVVEPVDVEEEPIVAEPVVSEPEGSEEEPIVAEPVVSEPEGSEEEPIEAEPEMVEQEEASPVLKEGQETITVPTFEEKEEVLFMEPEVYEEQRQDIRTKAIQEVLDRIAPR